MEEIRLKKKQKLRNNEYYNMQHIFDMLYDKSCKDFKFNDIMKYISTKDNILLAYRNIKGNKGSVTAGTDGLNIDYIKEMGIDSYITYIQNKLNNYMPKSVRRVEIPKPNGKTRPLGIPCIDDRIIQQCIKQVLEPICEAKFHNHSYGFRPNRSTEHAIARSMFLMNRNQLHYVVDIDIKGFFENVNHSKLKKQIWNLGIQDKNLMCIIGKILKSEIEGIGIPMKGTPQGGIISPLLSNIVLNELDWWISSQWETFETKHDYTYDNKYRAMRNTKLKEIFIVRYADDFKIFCRDYKTAQKIFVAVKDWLIERLDLEISPEKSKITNLRRNYTEFLGFKLKVKPKNNKLVCQSRMCNKAVETTIRKLKEQVKVIQKKQDANEVIRLNSMILGGHNYYNKATYCSSDYSKINFLVTRTLDNRLKGVMCNKPKFSKTYNKLYGDYNGRVRTVQEVTIFPIYACKTKNPMNLTQIICNYTTEGRKLIHDNLKGYSDLIEYEINHPIQGNVEYSDNRVALIAGQQGKCYVTGERLEIGNMQCHHKIPREINGTDEYKNLVWLTTEVHILLTCTVKETIEKYLKLLNLDEKGLKKVNSLRKLVGNSII